MTRRLTTDFTAATAFWLFVTALYVAQIVWLASQPGERINLRTALVWQAGFYLCWIPLTVLVWRLTATWGPATLGWARTLVRHTALAAAVASAHSLLVIGVATAWLGSSGETLGQMLVGQLRGRGYFEVLIYTGVAAAGHALWLYDQWRDRQTEAARLEAQLNAARLAALQAQLHPHFLFNSLHAVASLAREGRQADVVRMVADLSELLRQVLTPAPGLVRLDAEVELARRYLAIEHVRFEDRLTVAIDIAPDAGAARVPALTLQPLVDNAIRHGIAASVSGGTVRIDARVIAGALIVTVENDVAAGPVAGTGNGTGLTNLRERLNRLCGPSASLVAGPVAGGFRVTVTVPQAEASR